MTWVFDDYRGTLPALARWVRPGGPLLVGEPFWRHPPDPAYLQASGLTATSFATHAGNAGSGLELGLIFLYSAVSSADEWDRYEGLQWQAAERYAAAHHHDADALEVVRRARASRDVYLRWERDTLGWALYLFQPPDPSAVPDYADAARPGAGPSGRADI